MRHAPCGVTCIVIRDRPARLDGQWRGWRNSRPHTGARRHNGHKQPHSYEPNGRRNKLVHPPHASAEADYRPSPAMQEMEATSSYDLGPESGKRMFYGVDESSLDDVRSSTENHELRAALYARDKQDEALRLEERDRAQRQAHKDAKALSDKQRLEADLRKQGDDMRMLLQRMAAIEEECAQWAARTGAATVKTEHGEGDVDKPEAKDDKMPSMGRRTR